MAHLSVRALVAFSHPGENLSGGASMRDMMDGIVSHKARQRLLGPGWESETPLSIELSFLGAETLVLSGRMDAFLPGDIPKIEEIKLCAANEPPTFPYPVHRAQAVVYGHMVACLQDVQTIQISTCYVDKKGGIVAAFDETLSKEDCEAEFTTLYEAYVSWQRMLRAHRQRRNETLEQLAFPYDTYRKGQREMAVQVFTAISRRKRLLAEMPTGTGKSAAVLFPAIKALGRELTEQIFYLTARTTQRKAAQDCLNRFRNQTLSLWTLTLTAKDKQCITPGGCDVNTCPFAIGFYLRLPDAISDILPLENWDEKTIKEIAHKHSVCPFEFSLSLSEIADVVIGDYNYALDPFAHVQRIFDVRRDMTLLIDESHNLMPRVRDMLSATLDTTKLRALRKLYPKRSDAMYKQLTAFIKQLSAMEGQGVISVDAPQLKEQLQGLSEALSDTFSYTQITDEHFELYKAVKLFLLALSGDVHAYLLEGGARTRRLTAFCLSVSEHILRATKGMRGIVFFSATLSPIEEMKVLLGGEDEDATFRMPSPFAPERFFIKRLRVNTRYAARETTLQQVACHIRTLFESKSGKYIAYFPSFKYLESLIEPLLDLPLIIQTPGMDEPSRDVFLNRFHESQDCVLGLCVMGGVFAEGIDLPGDKLLGVILVGVGLPMVNLYQETLRDYFQLRFGAGFRYAYQIPGMHKILQAAGRVIRTESDKGAALLIDDRYYQSTYEKLCPPHWRFNEGGLTDELKLFWDEQMP